MVTRSGERRRDCVVIGASLRAARDGNQVRRASPGLCGNWGKFEGRAMETRSGVAMAGYSHLI